MPSFLFLKELLKLFALGNYSIEFFFNEHQDGLLGELAVFVKCVRKVSGEVRFRVSVPLLL